jgi:hypothetical protein
VPTVSTQLKERYGNNFELRNLRRMMQFAEQFTNLKIVVPLSRQLSWSHFVELLPLKTIESKLFYAQNASNNLYGIRELRQQLALKAYERANIADTKNIESTKTPFNTFKDLYFRFFYYKEIQYRFFNSIYCYSCRKYAQYLRQKKIKQRT